MIKDNLLPQLKEIISDRRSVRKFTPEIIPESVIEECLDLALLAPNSSNLQPWEFYWIHGQEKKAKIAEYCFAQPAATTATELIAVVARPDLWKRGQKLNLEVLRKAPQAPKAALEYYEKIVPLAYGTDPLGISAAFKTAFSFFKGLTGLSYRGPFGRSANRLWATKTCALAAENFMLAVQAAGYGSCPMEGFDQARVKKFLDLPREAYVTMILGIGRPDAEGIYGPRLRGNRELFIKRVLD